MKIKVSNATGVQLDWLVAKCEGVPVVCHDDGITRCIMKSDGSYWIPYYETRAMADADDLTRSLFLLLLSEALADEGL